MSRPSAAYRVVKRGLDIAASAVLLILTSPVQAVVAVLVATRLGRPVLFTQERPGLEAKIFTLMKFRTMANPDPDKGLITDEQRLTPLGRALRATSLDELPTLWNVLRGDMSLVGPRPLLVDYLSLYTAEQARRHEVRPGVTGLAQATGRNALSWEDRFKLDVYYVDHVSFLLDLRVLLHTVRTVASRSGISEAGHATMSRFEGTHDD